MLEGYPAVIPVFLFFVIAGLGPATHEGACGFKQKNSWVTGPSPVMTR
jgi:hypothetical protein